MLYKFKSRAAADLIMLEPHGRQIVSIMGKTPGASGIVTVAQIPAASQKHAKGTQNIAHIDTKGGVSVTLAEKQNRRGHSEVAFCFDDMLHRQYGGIMINYSQATAFQGKYRVHPF